jgi:hypothetical protein
MRSRSDLRRVILVNYYVIANSFLLGIFSVNLFLGSLLVFVHIVLLSRSITASMR